LTQEVRVAPIYCIKGLHSRTKRSRWLLKHWTHIDSQAGLRGRIPFRLQIIALLDDLAPDIHLKRYDPKGYQSKRLVADINIPRSCRTQGTHVEKIFDAINQLRIHDKTIVMFTSEDSREAPRHDKARLDHGTAAFHLYGRFAEIAVNDPVEVRIEAPPSQVYAGPRTDSFQANHDSKSRRVVPVEG
jgi:hypothetical protein